MQNVESKLRDDKIIKVKNFNIETPVDLVQAKQGLGDSDKRYYNMLETFEDMTLTPVLKNIIAPFEERYWLGIKE